jgi:hypothetical protein
MRQMNLLTAGPALQSQFVFTASLGWTMAAVALSALLWVLLRAKGWGAAAGWTALAFAGQACSLQLLEVGTEIHLQLFFSWSALLHSFRGIFLGMLLLQAVMVLAGIWHPWQTERLRLRLMFSKRPMFALLAVATFMAAPFAPATVQALVKGGFAGKAAMHLAKAGLGLFIFAVSALNLALAAAAFPREVWERIVARWQAWDRKRLPWIAALWVVVVSSLLCWIALDGLPHVPDEVAYLFHAKYFAAGRLYLPLPAVPEAFYCTLVVADGDKFYSAQLPGWPGVLAIGAWAGVPWLVNPLLGGIAILLAHSFVRRLYDRTVADGTVLLLALSPWLLVMSATFMGHSVSLVFTLLGLIGVQRVRENGNLGWAGLAGLAIGMLADTRPLEAIAVASVAFIWWLSVGWKRFRFAPLFTTGAAGSAMLALHLAYNHALMGNPFLLPFEKLVNQRAYPGANRLGFGAGVGNLGWLQLDPLEGHGPIDVLVNTNHNAYMTNFELFGWACGSLLLVALLLVWGRWRRDALMWGLTAGVWAAMSLYWFSGGPDYGARYWYQMILPLAVLSVRGAQEARARWGESEPATARPLGGQRIWAFVALASLMGTVNLLPWRTLDKYKNYRYVRGDVRRLAREHQFGHSLVLVRGETVLLPWQSSAFASAFSLNPPTLDREEPGPIYARDLGPVSNERLRRYYSDRPVWVLEQSSPTHADFRVVEGPLPPLRTESQK